MLRDPECRRSAWLRRSRRISAPFVSACVAPRRGLDVSRKTRRVDAPRRREVSSLSCDFDVTVQVSEPARLAAGDDNGGRAVGIPCRRASFEAAFRGAWQALTSGGAPLRIRGDERRSTDPVRRLRAGRRCAGASAGRPADPADAADAALLVVLTEAPASVEPRTIARGAVGGRYARRLRSQPELRDAQAPRGAARRGRPSALRPDASRPRLVASSLPVERARTRRAARLERVERAERAERAERGPRGREGARRSGRCRFAWQRGAGVTGSRHARSGRWRRASPAQ